MSDRAMKMLELNQSNGTRVIVDDSASDTALWITSGVCP